jgi:hypothetical protein
MNFFNKLLTGNSGTSSKRFVALFFSFTFFIVIISSLFGIETNSEIIWSIVSLIAGGLGFSSLDKFSKNNNIDNEKG